MKTIRKTLMALGLLAGLSCGAQVMEKYPGYLLTKVSDNGRYLVSEAAGVSIIYDRQEKQSFLYGSQYVMGLGNAISDTGIAVASADNCSKPCVWRDGAWSVLPYDVSDPSIAMANGVTPDGSRIVGSMDCRKVTGKAWPMVSPVVWTWDEAEGRYVFEILPEPQTDITGCPPQQVSATFVSRDGKTVLGQLTDQRGMMEYQVVYRQGADGGWTCQTSGNERMQKEGVVWPPFPDRPTMPQAGNYLTDDERNAWDNAYQAYLDSLEIVSLTGKNPRLPFYDDFLNERKDEFDQDMKEYNARNESYLTDLYAFFDAYNNNLTKHRFEFNSHRLSGNGDFYASNYVYPAPESGDATDVKSYISPILYDLGGGGEPRLVTHESMGLYGVCDDGSMVVATPRGTDTNYSKTPYVILPGQEPVRYTEWLRDRSPEAAVWLEQYMGYDVEDTSPYETTPGGTALLPGTVRMSPDASKIIAYILEPVTNQYVSYFMDLDAEPVGVDRYREDSTLGACYDSRSGALCLIGNPVRVDLFDMTGRKVYGAANPAASVSLRGMVGAGVYIVRLEGASRAATAKIMVE